MGAGWPKISGKRGRPPTNHSSSQKTRLNDFSYCIKIWTDLSSVSSQCTRLTDRQQTDRRTEFSSLDRVVVIKQQKWYIYIYNTKKTLNTSRISSTHFITYCFLTCSLMANGSLSTARCSSSASSTSDVFSSGRCANSQSNSSSCTSQIQTAPYTLLNDSFQYHDYCSFMIHSCFHE